MVSPFIPENRDKTSSPKHNTDDDDNDDDDNESIDEAASKSTKGVVRLGRKGDPRMHRAMNARLAKPSLSLVEALIAGGFDIPPGSEGEYSLVDGVTLSQRKNQLSRRLRLARRHLDEIQKVTGPGPSLRPDDVFPGASFMQRWSFSSNASSGDGSVSPSRPNLLAAPDIHSQQLSANSLAAAQRAAVQSIKSRAAKHGRRRSGQLQDTKNNDRTSPFPARANRNEEENEESRAPLHNAASSSYMTAASLLAQHHGLSHFITNTTGAMGPKLSTTSIPAYSLGDLHRFSPATTNAASGFLSQALVSSNPLNQQSILASRNPVLFSPAGGFSFSTALSTATNTNGSVALAYLNALGQQQQLRGQINEQSQNSQHFAPIQPKQVSYKLRLKQEHKKQKSSASGIGLGGELHTDVIPPSTYEDNNKKHESSAKRRYSSSEALQLFSRLGTSSKKARSSGRGIRRQLSESKLRPAADLTSVLLSDTEAQATGQFIDAEDGISAKGSFVRANNTLPSRNPSELGGEASIVSSKEELEPSSTVERGLENSSADGGCDNKNACSFPNSTGKVSQHTLATKASLDFDSKCAVAAVSKDKIKSAIEYYQTQNNATLKQSTVCVGFNLPQTDDSSPAVIDFALLAIEAEGRRILELRQRIEDNNVVADEARSI